MSYKTILVHVDDSKHVDPRVETAAKISLLEDAHLIGLAVTGVSTLFYEPLALNPADPGIAPYISVLRQRAEAALKRFENIALQLGVKSFESRLIENETAIGVSWRARYCDLVVFGQFDPNDPPSAVTSDFPEYLVMNCGGPALLIPYVSAARNVGDRALIAWNGSAEAARAVHGAVPLLKRAKSVHAVIFNPDSRPEDLYGVPPGIELKLYLERHNIKSDVITRTTEIDVGDALLSLASDLGSDLLVMGCYGHSRFREIVLGGATRTILTSTTIPALLSH